MATVHTRDAKRVQLNAHLVKRRWAGLAASPAWGDLLSSTMLEGTDPPPVPSVPQVPIATGAPSVIFSGVVRRRRRRGLAWRRRRRWTAWTHPTLFAWWRRGRHLFAPKPFLVRRTTDPAPTSEEQIYLEKELAWWAIRAFDAVTDAQQLTFDAVYAAPLPAPSSIERTLFEDLLRVDPEGALPGLTGLGMDRVVILEQRADFVEAFLVGANEEMRRELRWRELPAGDAPLLRRFWSAAADDIGVEPFSAGPLGSHVITSDLVDEQPTARLRTWLLIRGAVLDQSPDIAIWMYPVGPDGRPLLGGAFLRPLTEIVVNSTTLLLCFPLTKADLDGHFLVFAEPFEGVRFSPPETAEVSVTVPPPGPHDRYYATTAADGAALAEAAARPPKEVWVQASRFVVT